MVEVVMSSLEVSWYCKMSNNEIVGPFSLWPFMTLWYLLQDHQISYQFSPQALSQYVLGPIAKKHSQQAMQTIPVKDDLLHQPNLQWSMSGLGDSPRLKPFYGEIMMLVNLFLPF